jgi:choline-sulfatase
VVALVTTYVMWRFIVRRKLGPLDTAILHAPAAAIAGTALAHAAWHRLGRRAKKLAGAAVAAIVAASIAFAVIAVRSNPTLTLEIWGDQPLAGLAIERVFDLDSIRSRISLAEYRPVERPGAAHPDIILVTIDTVRADHTPPYGGAAEMPVLAGLARRGTVFVNAFSPSNVTRRSIPSMIIGLHPHRIRGRVVGWALRVDPRHVMLAERLRAGGYETAGFMCCKGFWGDEARTGLQRGLEHIEIEYSGARLGKLARAWLDERDKLPDRRPLFLWMHLIEPHNWTAGTGLDIRSDDDKRKVYDRTLTQSDAVLLSLLGGFNARPPDRAPITIVTADHGESLGDHGAPYHSTDLYNSNLSVPFVIAGPGIQAQRVDETVSLTDLTPTIIELAGFAPPRDHSIDGRSVADLATGARPSTEGGTAFAAMIKDRSNPGGITAVVQGRWKLIDNGVTFELYDLRADPAERQNIFTQKPEVAGPLKQLLQAKQALGHQSAFD